MMDKRAFRTFRATRSIRAEKPISKLRPLLWRGWLAVLVPSIAILTIFAILCWRDLDNRQQTSARQGHDTSWFVARDIAGKFQEYRRELDLLADEAESMDDDAFSSPSLWSHMVRATHVIPYLRSVGFYDARGVVRQHSDRLGGYPDLSVADRPYFRALAANPSQPPLITAPIRSRIHNEIIIGMARAIHTKGGNFAGVMLIAISPDFFDLPGALPNLPPGSAVAIHHKDGINLFRAPFLSDRLALDVSQSPLFTEALPAAPVGIVMPPPDGSLFDGISRILAYRAMDSWPLVVVTGIPHDAVLADWRREWLRNAVLVGVALVGFSWLAIQTQRQATARLLAEVRLQRRELDYRLRVEAQLRHWATTDALTGLANRRHFLERCTEEMDRACRYDHPLSILILDVDFFKRINDCHGHAIGDMALTAIAKAAQDAIRDTDLAGRLGGEEFGILLPETDVSGAIDLAERIRIGVEALCLDSCGQRLHLSVSVGVATTVTKTSVDCLLAAADAALYRAKDTGRNRVVCAPTAPLQTV